jgi:hypothetical protein
MIVLFTNRMNISRINGSAKGRKEGKKLKGVSCVDIIPEIESSITSKGDVSAVNLRNTTQAKTI